MALIEEMPKIVVPPDDLRYWGQKWHAARAFNKKEGMDFGGVFDRQVGKALSAMLGGIEIITPGQKELLPAQRDVVEVGPVRIIGGIRPQNYDVGYRPDGVRFVFDSKTLNDTKSVSKNFQNMVNDLGSEAITVHTRFPYAVVGFMVVIPSPCFTGSIRRRFTRMLDRLVGRNSPIDVPHKAEAVSLVLWDPDSATIDTTWPDSGSLLRMERFSERVQIQYVERYEGMPPHDRPSSSQAKAMKEAGDELPEHEEQQDEGASSGG